MQFFKFNFKFRVLFFILFCFTHVYAIEDLLVFKKNNKVIESLNLAQIKKLTDEKSLNVIEPHESKEVIYTGFSFTDLLTKVYGEDWKKSELLLFLCADGYKDPIPKSLFDTEFSLLAYKKKGGLFLVNNKSQNEQNVKLGPYYLVWNNINNPQIKSEGSVNWPYQIIGIELTQFSTKFPKMIPKDIAQSNIQKGFIAFQKYCMSCHKINGDGGDKGPELNSPISVTERQNFKIYFHKLLNNPRDINPNSKMPALNDNLKNKTQIIDDIRIYLETMAKEKNK